MGLSINISVTVKQSLSLQQYVDLPSKNVYSIYIYIYIHQEAFDTISALLASFSVGWSWTKPFKF